MNVYRGIIESHVASKSAKKGTPGIEFTISIREKKIGADFVPCQWFTRSCWVYFPAGGDPTMNLKKLAFAGFEGGPLSEMDLEGNTVEVIGKMETYQGKEREKYELGLPARKPAEKDDDAYLAIDSVLQAAEVPDVDRPAAIDPEAKQPADAVASGSDKPARDEAPATPIDDDDVPF